MEIKTQYLQPYFEKIVLDQISEEYRQKGYKVYTEKQIGAFRADLFAEKDNEALIIEIKTGKMNPERKDYLKNFANYVRKLNYKFLVVFANPPKEKRFEIENLPNLLTDYFVENSLPAEITNISNYKKVDGVTDIDIDAISIQKGFISLVGTGVLRVEIGFQDYSIKDGISFDFELDLVSDQHKNFKIDSLKKLQIDISSYLYQ